MANRAAAAAARSCHIEETGTTGRGALEASEPSRMFSYRASSCWLSRRLNCNSVCDQPVAPAAATPLDRFPLYTYIHTSIAESAIHILACAVLRTLKKCSSGWWCCSSSSEGCVRVHPGARRHSEHQALESHQSHQRERIWGGQGFSLHCTDE